MCSFNLAFVDLPSQEPKTNGKQIPLKIYHLKPMKLIGRRDRKRQQKPGNQKQINFL